MLRNARETYLIEFKRILQNWFEKKRRKKNKLIIRIARNSRDQKKLLKSQWKKSSVFLFSIFQAPNVACGVGFSNTCNTLMQHRGLSLYFSWYYYISSIIWYSHAQKPPTDTTGSAVAWTMHFSIILTPQNVTF